MSTAPSAPASLWKGILAIPNVWLWAALGASMAALLGSLHLSWNMGLKACPLCLYQRTFVMGTTGVLVMGLMLPSVRSGLISLFALPMAVGGLAVAAFHEYLRLTGTLECPKGISGFAFAPQESLAILLILTVFLVLDILQAGVTGPAIAAVLCGLAFGYACVKSAPPSPQPAREYELSVDKDGCRRPYVPQTSPNLN